MAEKKSKLEESQQAIVDYFALSRYLFSDDAPSDVTDIPEDSPFYKPAREIAEDLKIEWDGMSHSDSNRVMLALLDDYYYNIKADDEYIPVLTISFKKIEHGAI